MPQLLQSIFPAVRLSFLDERLFKNPTEFIHERWTTRPELNHDASVFTPFSNG